MGKLENFIEKANKRHNFRYNYDKVKYINSQTKVCIICPEHGEFWQEPSAHVRGYKCPKCANFNRGSNKRWDKNKFIEESLKVHGNRFNYSKVEYKNAMDKVIITCPVHGDFTQTPSAHLNGQGCPKCAGKKLNRDEIIEKFIEVHGEKYDYSKVLFEQMHKKVCIICPEHGEFWQTPSKHFLGQGCKECSKIRKRKKRKIIYRKDFLPRGNSEIYNMLCDFLGVENVIISDDNIDILIPHLNIGIVYNYITPNNKWDLYDETIIANNKRIKLIHIFDDEFLYKKDIVIHKLLHLLKIPRICTKIMGRKVLIKEIDNEKAKEFLNNNHIQGYTNSTIKLGAYYQGILIGVMCFNKTGVENEWILNRFATDNKYICQGVGGKLFKYFIRNFNPEKVKSFADRRWTINEDNIYTKLGFKLVEKLNPDYRYISGSNSRERIHKFNLRKKTLHNKYGFPIDMTEKEMVERLGLYKIWDCGLYKYEWKINS